MLPSLCPSMTAIPSVSRAFLAAVGVGPESIELVYLPLAGSIGSGIVARLF
jgi:hypothetical protein